MNKLFNFMINNWQLIILLCVFIIGYLVFEIKTVFNYAKKISLARTIDMYNHKKAVLIDIRSHVDFKNGYIVGSLHVSGKDLNIKFFNKYLHRPIIIISTNGSKTDQFAKHLKECGITEVLSLIGGINSWKSAGLPLIKS